MADRKHISTETKLRLFSSAAGHCQCPDCLQTLFPAEMGGDKHIAELAHVIPHGDKGPRHEERPEGDFEADTFDNLILLCPTCHTIIDKAPEGYSRATLVSWKAGHLTALGLKQGLRAYEDRQQVRNAISEAKFQNKAVWKEFAPEDGSSFEYDPESEAAKTWDKRMRGVILPNHYRIEAIMKANIHNLTHSEMEIFARYQEHIRGLVERHVCNIAGSGIRYPVEMDEILL